MSASEYSVYVLRCADDSLYTGIAIDVDKRLQEHREGARGAKYLRGRGPLILEFQQRVGGRSTASRVEHRIKQLERVQKEALLAGRLTLRDLLTDIDADRAQASGAIDG